MSKDFLKKARQFLGISQTEMANEIGFSPNKIKNVEAGKQDIQSDMALAIEEKYGISAMWLIFGRGEMSSKAPTLDIESDCVYIKFYEDIVTGFSANNNCDKYELLKIDRKLLNPKVNPEKHYAVRVLGDSMEPTFKSGDVIFFELYNGDFANNRVYIIKRQDDVLVKRLKKSGDVFEIMSDNTDYLPYTLSANEFQIIGRVV